MLQAIDKFKPTIISSGSHHVMQIAAMSSIPNNLDLSSMKLASPMGVTLPINLTQQLRKIFPELQGVLNGYGTSEGIND